MSTDSLAPSAPARDAAMPLRNGGALRIIVGILILAVAVNIVLPLLLQRTDAAVLSPVEGGDGEIRSEGVVLATPVDAADTLVATLDNRVLWLENGAAVREAQFDNLVGGLAIAADGEEIYVGTSGGQIFVLDGELQTQRDLPITGRVVGLRAVQDGEGADGGFLAAYGSGAFSDRYWTAYYPAGSDQPAYTTRAEFTITAMDGTSGGGAVYGTANSRVSRLDAEGVEQWKSTLTQPPTAMEFDAASEQTLVGDERGNLTLLSGSGATLWAINLSQYPLRSVQAIVDNAGDSLFLAGDDYGNLFAVDAATTLLFSERAATSSVQAIQPVGAALTLIARNGAWQAINPGAMRGAGLAATLRLGWLGVNIALLLALLAATVAAVERWRRATIHQLRFAWRQRVAYFFVLPAVALILLFSYYPALMAFYYSLTDFSLRSVTEFVGLANYRKILTNDFYFRVGFGNLALILVFSLLKTLTVPLLVAELIFRLRNSVHQYVFRTLFVLPAVVPGLITVYLWRMVYDPYAGLLNETLRAVGLSQWTTAWLGNESTALWAIIAAGFPYISAFPFLIFMGGLLNISTEMYDAARMDGAGWWRQFWHIDVPLLTPQTRLLLFFTLAGAIQGFAQVYIYTRGGPGYATYVPGLQMYYQIAEGDFGYASAIGVVLFAIIFSGTIFLLRFRREAEV